MGEFKYIALTAYALFVLGFIGFAASIIHPFVGLGLGVVAMLPVLAKSKRLNVNTNTGDAE